MQQLIAVNNMSGCIFNFSVQLLDPPTMANWHTTDWNSGNYQIGQSRTSRRRHDRTVATSSATSGRENRAKNATITLIPSTCDGRDTLVFLDGKEQILW
jgi:hypothetical protein